MGLRDWYDAYVMPRIVKCGCSQGPIMERRSHVVPLASGTVFELGCGGGFNQEFYDTAAVTRFCGIDPHAGLLESARGRARARGWDHNIFVGFGEDIPFSNEEFDTAVCTFTLCSVQDPARVISELRRILKPGGRLLFLEHGRAPDASVARWQDRIEPVWKRIAGGCHLTRPITSAIMGGGFDVASQGQGYLPKSPRFAGWMEWGVAQKIGA